MIALTHFQNGRLQLLLFHKKRYALVVVVFCHQRNIFRKLPFMLNKGVGGDLLVEELHDPVSKRVGRVLRKIREEQGLTRAQLSEKSTVSERQISAIELGEKGPRLNSLELLLRSLGASADQLFYPELSENDPMLAQIVHLAGACNAQQKRMIVAFIQMLQAEEYGENK